ncbi:hypothetical protein CMU05_14760 [Elizabethkingia anophelis]|nr:hypothetical protein [Elizabethkingia anophelis]MDV4036833.1 hypothetical protein [Elizabethkingia anophelis]
MNELYFIHALDETTSFLRIFQKYFQDNFFIIEPNKDSVESSIKYLKEIPKNSTVVFLGHGHSFGLYSPESSTFEKCTFVDTSNVNGLFVNKKVILLSCRSREFISKITSAEQMIGFGNILSSPEELIIEADLETGHYRNLSNDNIHFFNSSYCDAIIKALDKYKKGRYRFDHLPILIEFYINQKINETLLNKTIENRVEIARLLFEFRNEILFQKK